MAHPYGRPQRIRNAVLVPGVTPPHRPVISYSGVNPKSLKPKDRPIPKLVHLDWFKGMSQQDIDIRVASLYPGALWVARFDLLAMPNQDPSDQALTVIGVDYPVQFSPHPPNLQVKAGTSLLYIGERQIKRGARTGHKRDVVTVTDTAYAFLAGNRIVIPVLMTAVAPVVDE